MRALLHAPTKSAMQSGLGRVGPWVLQPLGGQPGEPEPVMGWVPARGTADEVRLAFPTRDGALAFAARAGWAVVALPAQARRVVPRNFDQTIR